MYELLKEKKEFSVSFIRKRNRLKTYLSIVLLSVSIVIVLFMHQYLKFKTFPYLLVPVYVVADVLQRVLLFVDEFRHLSTRYENRLSLVLHVCFQYLHYYCLCLVLLPILIYVFEIPYDVFLSYFLLAVIFACWRVFCGPHNMEWNEIIKNTPSLGSLYALSCYTSYYKTCLEDIQERILHFEESHSVGIPLRKMLLVIPLSCDVRGTLDKNHQHMQYVADLNHIPNDQGANINRNYKNPVYRILRQNESLHVVVEQPNSLLAFWKMKSRNMISKDVFDYQRNLFISCLQQHLIGSPCIILLYDDTKSSQPLSEFLWQNVVRLVTEDEHKVEIPIL